MDQQALERIDAAAERRAGDRRVVAPTFTYCGSCAWCTRGMYTHCPNALALATAELPGALAERFTLPIRCLTPVGPDTDDDSAAFASLLAEAVHATNQVHLQSKPYVTVLGDTPVGLLCAQLMARRNASVRLVGRDDRKLALCEKWAVKHRPLEAVGRHADQDVVVDCTMGAGGLRVALGLAKPRGQVLLRWPWRDVDPDPSTLDAIARKELTLLGSRGAQLTDAVRMLDRGEVDVVSLITRRFTFAEADAAFRSAATPQAAGVLVSP